MEFVQLCLLTRSKKLFQILSFYVVALVYHLQIVALYNVLIFPQSTGLSDDDSAFTTEWELKVARKKVANLNLVVYFNADLYNSSELNAL